MYSTTKGNDDYEFIFKVLLLGNSNVGKSSLFLRFVDDIWNDTFVPTIGVDFKIKTFDIDEKKIKMQIWDTAGQERFKNIIASYYRGAHGILLIYDVTDKDSFKNLSNWLIEIEENKTMNYFIYCYFDFMGELYTTDAYFFNLAKDAKIMKVKQFESFFEKLAEKQFNKVPIEVEYGICRYYLAIKNPLNFNFN